MELKYSFKCICGVILYAELERQLETMLKRHAKDSKIHKAQGWEDHSGLAGGEPWN